MKLFIRLGQRFQWHRNEARRLRIQNALPPTVFQRAENFFQRFGGRK